MQQNLNSLLINNPSSSSQKMPAHQNDHHLNEQQIPIYHHQQHQDFESSTPHDDFLEHMISTFQNPTSNNSNWDPLPTNGPDSPSSTKSAMAMMMLQNQMMMMSRGGVENDDSVVHSLVNGFNGSGPISNPNQNFHQNQTPNFGATSGAAVMNGAPANGSGGGGAPTQPRQRVRARRGQATDPHSIAERLRRERIAERMKSLQELVPNANKTDKASMLDEIIDYVKFLQLQVKVLSMSRLGGAGAVAPLVTNLSSEGGSDFVQTNGAQTSSTNDNMTVTEHQVAKLMEQDMGSAMQYLQGKGLCLMPISLANAISSSTCHSRSHLTSTATTTNGEGSLSPTMSVLTVQSANGDNGAISKP